MLMHHVFVKRLFVTGGWCSPYSTDCYYFIVNNTENTDFLRGERKTHVVKQETYWMKEECILNALIIYWVLVMTYFPEYSII